MLDDTPSSVFCFFSKCIALIFLTVALSWFTILFHLHQCQTRVGIFISIFISIFIIFASLPIKSDPRSNMIQYDPIIPSHPSNHPIIPSHPICSAPIPRASSRSSVASMEWCLGLTERSMAVFLTSLAAVLQEGSGGMGTGPGNGGPEAVYFFDEPRVGR